MIQYNSRINVDDNGIEFYEQDILYDDYLYSGDIDITLKIDYANPGFGVALIDNEGNSIINSKTLIFKLGCGTFEIIEKDINSNISMLFSTSASPARPYKKDMILKISKRNNTYTFNIGDLEIKNLVLKTEMNNYILGYYSNKGNVIKSINIASAIPYGWVVNMTNTDGGYVSFNRDSFTFEGCNNNAELEQLNIRLSRGHYYLKFNRNKGSDIKPYVIISEDERMSDEEKNLLNTNNEFDLPEASNVSLKFVGTEGTISNICITTASDNKYLRTTIQDGENKSIYGSYVKFLLNSLSYFEFVGHIEGAPGIDHYSPLEYSIVNINNKSYGLYDMSISEGVEYKYIYKSGEISVYDRNNTKRWSASTDLATYITVFNNVNGYLTSIKLIDLNGNEYYYGVHNEITKYVPGLIKSPIVVLDREREDEKVRPLDLSSSYRIIEKEHGPYYYFTNVEREYFEAKRRIVLEKVPLQEKGSIKIYLIDKDADFDLDKIYHIPDKGPDTIMDTIDLCVRGQYMIVTEDEYDEYGVVVYRDIGEIIFNSDLSEYKYIIVDYFKNDSYAINYDYSRQSYSVDISTTNEKVSVVYDNIENTIGRYEYINEQKYVDSKIIPSENCYIVIGS